MATWYVRPLPEGGWQVLTPGYTQACAICCDHRTAVRAACARVADEGGGQVVTQTNNGQFDQLIDVGASHAPFKTGLSPSG